MMKEYTIWAEGYVVTGQSGKATKLGTYTAPTFKDAVKQLWLSGDDDRREYLNVDRMTYWGCRLFDSEKEARVSFG